MFWYDVILMMERYNEIMEKSERDNKYEEDFKNKQDEYAKQMSNIKLPSYNMPNMSSITSGIKMPSF